MAYHLELANNTNTARIGQFSKIRDVWAVIELEGENRLSFTVDKDDPLFDSPVVRNYVRIVRDDNSADYISFIIQSINIEKSGGEFKHIECEGLKYALMDNIVEGKKPYAQITATTALTIALAGSGFTVGTVDVAAVNLRDIEFDWPTSLEALQQIIDTWTYLDGGVTKRYYYSITEAKVVSIRTLDNLGTTKYFYMHYDKNINSIVKSINANNMANKVHAVGADGFSIERANATNYELDQLLETAGGGGNDYITTQTVVAGEAYTGVNVYIYDGTGVDQIREITDTMPANGLRISPDWTTNPDATSEFCTPSAVVGTPCTHTLGVFDANSQSACKQTLIQIPVQAHCYWTSGAPGAGSVLTFTITINLLDNSNNIITTETQTVNQDAILSGLETDSTVFYMSIGEITNIRKIKMTLVSASFSGSGAGRPFLGMGTIIYSLSSNVTYIEDATSQSTYGTVVGKYENQNIIDTKNLVSTPALDGTYTGGLCENWIEIGSPTTAENTTATYIRHGNKSQKVTNTASGDGIYGRIYLRSNISYSASVLVYIDSTYPGQITVTLDSSSGEADTVATATGAGWIEITIENFSYNFGALYGKLAYIDLKITSTGTTTVYYVDAVQVAEGTEVKPFVKGDSADVLYEEAYNDLQFHKDPEVAYDINLTNLYEIDPAKYSGENFNVGDQIRIVDRDLVIDDNILCVRKGFNPLDPGPNCQIGLENKRLLFRNSLMKAVAMSIRTKRV